MNNYTKQYNKSKSLVRDSSKPKEESSSVSDDTPSLHDWEIPHEIARVLYRHQFYNKPEYEIPTSIQKAIDNINKQHFTD